MALPSITIASTFVGSIKLTGNEFKQTEFQEYIDSLYPDKVEELLGNAVLQYLENTATLPQRWLDLLNGVSYYNIDKEKTMKVKGLISTIVQQIYFEISRDNFNASHAGNVKGKAEVSDRLTNNENAAKAATEYNRGVWYFNYQLIPFLENYKDFSQAIDSIVGSTVFTSETFYLEDDDTITINGTEYTVSNVVADTSFDVNGSPVSGAEYISNPFELVDYCMIDPILA